MSQWGRARAIAASFVLLAAGMIGVQEAAGLIGAVSINGNTYQPDVLYSLTAVWHAPSAFGPWAQAAAQGVPIESWLRATIWFDVLVIVGYSGVLGGLSTRWSLHLRWYVIALAAADAMEDVFSLVAIDKLPHGNLMHPAASTAYHHDVLLGVLAATTVLKWAALGVVLAVGGYRVFTTASVSRRIRTAWRIAGHLRFAIFALVLLGVLMVLPGTDIMQQAVDLERAWFLGEGGRGVGYFLTALLGLAVLAGVLRYLASVLAGAQAHLHDLPPDQHPHTVVGWVKRLGWAIAGVAFLLIALLLQATDLAEVYWAAVWCVAGVLIGVSVLSVATSWVTADAKEEAGSVADARLIWKGGRLLAAVVLVIFGLSVFRAYVSTSLVGTEQGRSLVVLVVALVAAVALIVAVLSTGLTPLIVGEQAFVDPPSWWGFLHPQRVGSDDEDGPSTPLSIVPAALLTVPFAVVLLVFPAPLARVVGAIGVIGVCLAAIGVSYLALVLASLLIRPPHVFRVLRLRRTPVLMLFAITVLLSTLISKDNALHRIRGPVQASGYTRPVLTTAFDSWLKSGPCAVTLSTTDPPKRIQRVRPLLMVAAEGGGIRAAWWTVDAMRSLSSTDCSRRSILLASGVSGGATGLAVMATSAKPRVTIGHIGDQDGVSGAIEGMLSRDLLAGTAGINLKVASGTDDAYPDRATLLEQAWEQHDSGLDRPFPLAPSSVAPWYTVFNSTSVLGDCRVLVSNVRFGGPDTDCRQNTGAPGTYDLFDRYPCLDGIRASTASLLAARFPYVTPSGDIAGCDGGHSGGGTVDQLVDGGYAENTGLDTVIDALTVLMPAIRAENRRVLTRAPSDGVVVPMVLFLHNKPSASVGAGPTQRAPDPQVVIPPSTGGINALGASGTLLARAQAIADQWVPDTVTGADTAQAVVNNVLTQRAVTIAPAVEPQVAQPLGWALSGVARTALDRGLDAYLRCAGVTCAAGAPLRRLLPKLGVPMCFDPDVAPDRSCMERPG